MSNKHFVKRLRRLARRAGVVNRNGLTSIKQLYDVARSTEVAQRKERMRQVNIAYAQARSEQTKTDEIARLINQDKARSAASRRGKKAA